MRIHAHRHYAFALAWALLPVYVEAQTLDTKPHPGHMLLETYCTVCHNLDYVTMQHRITRGTGTGSLDEHREKNGARVRRRTAKPIYRAGYYQLFSSAISYAFRTLPHSCRGRR